MAPVAIDRRPRPIRMPAARRVAIMTGVVLAHLAALVALLAQHGPVAEPRVDQTLAIFDVAIPVPPPPPPPPPLPPPAEATRPAARGGGAARPQRVARAPAFAPIARQVTLDATLAIAMPASLPMAAPLPGLVEGDGGGSGAGRGGGTGDGTGPGGGTGDGVGFGRAAWLRRPTMRDTNRFFPPQARDAKLSGRALLACRVPKPGPPDGCEAIAEAPVGHGFGAAAVQMSPLFRIRPVTRKGEPMTNVPIVIPVEFTLKGAGLPPVLTCPAAYCAPIPGYRPRR